MYCATCVDSNKSAERLANPNSTFVTGTDNFRLDSLRSHESSIPHVQVTKLLCFNAILRKLLENGKAVNTFVALKECPNGKAQGITEAITLTMDEKDGNWKDKTACLGTDGANVMVGQHRGVFGILKQDIPSRISVHCIAHKLELGLQDPIKGIPLFQEVKELLQGMWKYYKYSCKALKELKDLAESMDEKAYKCI